MLYNFHRSYDKESNSDDVLDCGVPLLSSAGLEAINVQSVPVSKFSNPQSEVLNLYKQEYKTNLKLFINTAPHQLRPLRAFIVEQAMSLSASLFENFLDEFYPIITDPESKYFKQNQFLRNTLLTFNKLCIGEEDVNVLVYQQVFDPRLSPTKHNAQSMKKMLAQEFINNTQRMLEKVPEECISNNTFVKGAQEWIQQQDESTLVTTNSVRRALMF